MEENMPEITTRCQFCGMPSLTSICSDCQKMVQEALDKFYKDVEEQKKREEESKRNKK
jgi:hypothetical protein